MYLADLVGSVPTTAHIEQYAEMVKERSRLRKIIAAGVNIVRAGYEPGARSEDLLDAADRELMAVTGDYNAEAQTGEDLADGVLRDLDKNLDPTGLKCHLPIFDWKLGGLRRGEFIIVAARANIGKTTVVLNVLREVAGQGYPVLFFSLEMDPRTVAGHLVRQGCGINPATQKVSVNERAAVREAAEKLRALPFRVEGTRTLSAIRSKVRRAVNRRQCALVIIDYIGLIRGGEGNSRQERVASISNALKTLACDAAVPVLALCQLNRMCEQREDRRPRLSDLRDSGAQEQDADAVILLHRPNKDRPLRAGGDDGKMKMILAKSRNTATGAETVWMDLRTGRLYPTKEARDGFSSEARNA